MQPVVRLGDVNTAGAPTIEGRPTVFVNNRPINTNGDAVAGHPPGGIHAAPHTANGSSTVFAENKPVNFLSNADTCGHTRATGSPDTYTR